jgi:hypothetical protein
MTNEERIEAAAWRIHESRPKLNTDIDCAWPDLSDDWKAVFRTQGRIVLETAFPELFADPPTAWIAPWEFSKEDKLEIITKWAIWTQQEVSEIAKSIDYEKMGVDDLMRAQDKGWRQGFQSLSSCEFDVVWNASRDLGRQD